MNYLIYKNKIIFVVNNAQRISVLAVCSTYYLIVDSFIWKKVVSILATSIIFVNATSGPLEILRTLIQDNLAGPTVIHQKTEWEFDPDIALKRRELFQRVNGFRGEKLIERLGLGVDGNHDARLAEQQKRDEGLLGGTIFQLKSGLNTIDRV